MHLCHLTCVTEFARPSASSGPSNRGQCILQGLQGIGAVRFVVRSVQSFVLFFFLRSIDFSLKFDANVLLLQHELLSQDRVRQEGCESDKMSQTKPMCNLDNCNPRVTQESSYDTLTSQKMTTFSSHNIVIE